MLLKIKYKLEIQIWYSIIVLKKKKKKKKKKKTILELMIWSCII